MLGIVLCPDAARCDLQGMLGIGAAVLGASHVLGIDLDPDALEVAQSNCDDFDDLPV